MPRLGPFKWKTSRSESNNSADPLTPSPDTGKKKLIFEFFSKSQDNVFTPNDSLQARPSVSYSRSLSDSDHQNANPAFQEALDAYKSKLSPEEYAAFQSANDTFQSPETLIEQAKQSDEKHYLLSSSRKLATRFQNILTFLDKYLITLAPSIQPSPEISSLVVGGFKFVLQLALKFAEFSEKITKLLEVTADELSVLSKYATSEVFRSSEEVQKALVATYGDLLDLCKKIREIFTNDKGNNSTRAISFKAFQRIILLGSFESQFSDILDGFNRHAKIVRQHAKVQDNIDSIKDRRTREDDKRWKLLRLLSEVEFDEPHRKNFSKRHEKTGEWILESRQFEKWIGDPCSSLLWCHGTPGVGKTVLTSLVLEAINTVHGNSEDIGISFAYCNYKEQLQPAVYLATFLKQLLRKIEDWPEELQTSLENCHRNAKTPDLQQLQKLLLTVSQYFTTVFIIIDAIDEFDHRSELLEWFQSLFQTPNTKPHNIKIFATSRKETDIEESFSAAPTIQIEATKVNADIELYVNGEVDRRINSKKLRLKNPSLKEDIVCNLLKNADGMFLWVQLQLDYICNQTSDKEIEDALRTLPDTIEETYERIVDKIKKQPRKKRELAEKVLMWVACAARPLSIEELAEAVAIETNTTNWEELNMRNSLEILVEVCMNLVTLQPDELKRQRVRFVHYSVQEFFLPRLQPSAIPSKSLDSAYNIDLRSANETIAKSCITYMLFSDFEETKVGSFRSESFDLHKFPFLIYAADFWDHHLRKIPIVNEELWQLVYGLLKYRKNIFSLVLPYMSFRTPSPLGNRIPFWMNHAPSLPPIAIALCLGIASFINLQSIGEQINIHELREWDALHFIVREGSREYVEKLLDLGLEADDMDNYGIQPLYYAAEHGNTSVVQLLLEKGVDVNIQGGFYGNALQAASCKGSLGIVRLLLDYGADTNLQGGEYGNALQAASWKGSLEVVRLLLDKGADINLQGGTYGNALQAASQNGSLEVVRLLLDKGADTNLQGGRYGNALQAASRNGSLEVVRLLLDKGADINSQGGEYGNVLQAASRNGSLEVVRLLLDKGADIYSQGGEYGNALQAASWRGSLEVVQLLLDKGADINLQGGTYGNALQAASRNSSLAVVRLLLDKGADINLQGGQYGNALQAALCGGSPAVVLLLLDKGADINLQGGSYGNALQAALSEESSFESPLEVVRLLLDKGADINLQGGFYGNALQAASWKGSLEVVRLLLDKGADINLHGGEFGSALQAASLRCSLAVVRLLLDKGADVNLQSGIYGNALQTASLQSSLEVVRLLLDKGADINLQGGEYGNALQAASYSGSREIVQLLLDKGADINFQGGEYGNALQAASSSCRRSLEVVRLLLDKGADINLQGGRYGNALQAASSPWRNSLEVVRLLLDKGADINLQGGEYGTALQAVSWNGHAKIVQLLLDKGADINLQGGKYGNALQAASSKGHGGIVRLLRKNGAISGVS